MTRLQGWCRAAQIILVVSMSCALGSIMQLVKLSSVDASGRQFGQSSHFSKQSFLTAYGRLQAIGKCDTRIHYSLQAMWTKYGAPPSVHSMEEIECKRNKFGAVWCHKCPAHAQHMHLLPRHLQGLCKPRTGLVGVQPIRCEVGRASRMGSGAYGPPPSCLGKNLDHRGAGQCCFGVPAGPSDSCIGGKRGLAWTCTVLLIVPLFKADQRGLALGLNEAMGYTCLAAMAPVYGQLERWM
eukprot:scaffold85572_cov19-Tisochrysis_lutea.AAC.1